MSFPIEPQVSEPANDFLIQDPFGLRRAIPPFFAFDLSDGMLAKPLKGAGEGLRTPCFVTPRRRQLSVVHVATDWGAK